MHRKECINMGNGNVHNMCDNLNYARIIENYYCLPSAVEVLLILVLVDEVGLVAFTYPADTWL